MFYERSSRHAVRAGRPRAKHAGRCPLRQEQRAPASIVFRSLPRRRSTCIANPAVSRWPTGGFRCRCDVAESLRHRRPRLDAASGTSEYVVVQRVSYTSEVAVHHPGRVGAGTKAAETRENQGSAPARPNRTPHAPQNATSTAKIRLRACRRNINGVMRSHGADQLPTGNQRCEHSSWRP